MSPERIPEAVQLDPESDSLPPGLDGIVAELESPILLLVAPDGGDPVVRAAIALAQGRQAAGHPTVLADLSGDARLHEHLGVDNVEGMADVLLYGASPARVTTRPPGRPFGFIPAGAYLPDDPALLDDHRWAALESAMRAQGTGAAMLIFATAATPAIEAISRRLGRAVLVGGPTGYQRSRDVIDPWCEVVAVVEPASADDAAEPAASEPVAGEPVGGEPAVAGPVEEDDDGWIVSDSEAAAVAGSASASAEPEEPPVARRQEDRRKVSPILWVLLALTLALGAWFVYTDYLAAPAPPPATPETEGPAAPALEQGEAVETPLPISVAVEAHPEFEAARERVETLRAAEPGVEFFLAPTDVQDVIYYRLMAGPLPDRESGQRLMERLLEAGHITAAQAFAIQNTPLAFELGEYGSAAVAGARVDSLATLGVPAYVVPIRYEPGPVRFRVYGGAYEAEGAAAAMRRILEDAGVEAELVTRTGEPVVGS